MIRANWGSVGGRWGLGNVLGDHQVSMEIIGAQ